MVPEARATATRALLQFAADGQSGGCSFDGAEVGPAALERATVEEGSAIHQQAGGHRYLDLSRRDLKGVSLRDADLSRADLRNADMSDVRGGGLVLQGAQLEGTKLDRIDLAGADLNSISAGEASFADAMLEDVRMDHASLRFADFTGAVLEGADLTEADLWGAKFIGATADRAVFQKARLDESSWAGAQLPGADLSGATLRRANLSGAKLNNANLRDAVLDGADLSNADLTGASLPNLSLTGCNLQGVSLAGAWLERTRMRAHQLGGAVGEEVSGDLLGAIDSYVVLERNFLSLGLSDDASWAYLHKRRVGRRLHAVKALAGYREKNWRMAAMDGLLWLSDTMAEWLCNYGESLARVARAFVCILVGFAIVYWVTSSLKPRDGFAAMHMWAPVNYLLFSLDSMTTVGTSEVALRPKGELGVLLSSVQTVMGTVLLGLFGFVLGARIRS